MKLPTTLVISLAALLSSAHGALLVTYSFTGAAANSTGSFAAEGPASGLAATQLTGTNMGSGTASTGGVVTSFFNPTDGSAPGYVFDNAGYEVTAAVMTNDSNAGSIDTAPLSSFSFSITPTIGNAILYTGLSLDFGWDLTITPNGTSVLYDLFYSINGGTFAQIGARSGRVTSQNHSVIDNLNKDITAMPAFANPLTDTVTFQLRFADDNSTSDQKHLFIDDIKLNGTISAIPEPASSILILSSGLVLLRRRRR
jgi:putative intracellular protease/amidase